MISTNDVKPGMALNLPDGLFSVVDYQHVKPGKGKAFVRMKLKNVRTGAVLDKTFRAGEKFEEADIQMKTVQYLYNDGTDFVFMDNDSFDQLPFSPEVVGDNAKFLMENMEVSVMFYKSKPINIDLPPHVILEVTETEPGLKGDTASNTLKAATVETGAHIMVQLFINRGDKIRVDTQQRLFDATLGDRCQ